LFPLPVVLAAVLGAVLPVHASAQSTAQPEPNGPTITTMGDGVVRRAPDRAFIDISVENRAKAPRDAQAQNADAMSTLQQKLRAANLLKDAVRTIGYGVEPEFDFTNGRRVLRDYVARNTIEVRLDDLNRVGEVVDLATASGATSVGDVRFDLKDRQAAEREALGLAVADARARAEAIATSAGRPILAIWRIVEEGASVPGPRPMMAPAGLRAESMAPTPISAGDIEVHARVTLTALLK
jgi:uncharacterized protein YggE